MDLPVLRFPPLDVGVWCLGGPSSSSSVALIPSLNDGRVDGSRVVGSSPNSWRRIKTCLNFPPKSLIRVYIGTVPQGFCDSGYCEKSLIVTILAQEYLVRNWNCYNLRRSVEDPRSEEFFMGVASDIEMGKDTNIFWRTYHHIVLCIRVKLLYPNHQQRQQPRARRHG